MKLYKLHDTWIDLELVAAFKFESSLNGFELYVTLRFVPEPLQIWIHHTGMKNESGFLMNNEEKLEFFTQNHLDPFLAAWEIARARMGCVS